MNHQFLDLVAEGLDAGMSYRDAIAAAIHQTKKPAPVVSPTGRAPCKHGHNDWKRNSHGWICRACARESYRARKEREQAARAAPALLPVEDL